MSANTLKAIADREKRTRDGKAKTAKPSTVKKAVKTTTKEPEA